MSSLTIPSMAFVARLAFAIIVTRFATSPYLTGNPLLARSQPFLQNADVAVVKVIVALALLTAAANALAAPAPGKPNMSPEALARALQSVPKQQDTKAAPGQPDTLVDIKKKAE